MTQVAFVGRLAAENLMNSPAAQIVTRPGHELWNNAANNAALIQQLCQNFHHYGRTNGWQWTNGVGANGGAHLGRPLVAGTTNATNCGGFNASVRWIASHILNLPAAVFTNMGATTPDRFITSTGTIGIDATWTGNVRTLATAFAALGAYRFTAHSWNRLVGGQHYDASTNNLAFANKHALFYCTLGTTARVKPNCFVVSMRHQPPAIPGPAPYFCIGADVLKQEAAQFPIVQVGPLVAGQANVAQGFINAMPTTTGAGNWAAFLLVSGAHLPPAFVANYL